jgi:transposase
MRFSPDLRGFSPPATILEVYRVEHAAKESGIVRSPMHRDLRQQRSKPAMQALHAWLVAEQPEHLPQSPMGKAISYALNQWPALTVFPEDPKVPVDNNAAERALRKVAVGRKNFLFVGNDDAGQNLAVLLTLVQTCELAGVNPQPYLADVLMRVADHPASRIDELLPDKWHPPAGSG